MKSKVVTTTILAVTSLLWPLQAARAGYTIYTDRSAFDAAVIPLYGSPTIEGYEAYPNDLGAGARTLTLSDFKVSYNLTGDDSSFGITDMVDSVNGLGPTAGSKYLLTTYPTANGPSNIATTFLFGTGINAFGTDIKDLELADLTFSTDSGDTGTAATAGSNGNVQFFGIVSDSTFTSIGFSEPPASTGDSIVFDQTAFAGSVPEPSSLVLTGIGTLIGLACARRRRLAA